MNTIAELQLQRQWAKNAISDINEGIAGMSNTHVHKVAALCHRLRKGFSRLEKVDLERQPVDRIFALLDALERIAPDPEVCSTETYRWED